MKISIVIPVFNEADVIESFHAALLMQLQSIGVESEIVYVDDGSTDGTRDRLDVLTTRPVSSEDSRSTVRVIHLASNYGQMMALREGLRNASGDAIVTMDADFQDPPEVIVQFLREFQRGNSDAVIGVRKDRARDTLFKRVSAKLFYRLGTRLFRGHQIVDAGEFRLVSRELAARMLDYSGSAVVFRFLVPYLTDRISVVDYERPSRVAGETHYSLSRMFQLSLNSLLEYSDAPSIVSRYLLRAYLAVVSVFLALIFVGFFFTELQRGWITLFAVILLVLGALLVVSSFILRYQKLIYDQLRGWPPPHFDAKSEFQRGR